MKPLNDNRGSTMILVVWVLGILSMIAAFLIYRSETEWAAMASLERNMAVRQLATAILNERLDMLLADDNESDTPAEPWFNGNGISTFERDGYQVKLIIEDEGSKPNLNLLEAETLQLVINEKANIDILLDWIDPDDDPRNEGVEKSYYQALSPSYLPRNGFTASLNELAALKNGGDIRKALAPHCTVYGKYNPNTLSRAEFENLMLCYGIEPRLAERMAEDFALYRSKNRFENSDQLLQLQSVSLQTLERIKPLFVFSGQCNINLIGKTGLKLFLKESGYDPIGADAVIARRTEDPFDTLEELKPFLKSEKKEIRIEDFFAVASSIFRIQIWLTKDRHRYYLDTVQFRKAGEEIGNEWKIQVLSWKFLSNDELSDIPEVETKRKRRPMNKSIGVIYLEGGRCLAIEVSNDHYTDEVVRFADQPLPAEGIRPEWLNEFWSKEKFTTNRVIQMLPPELVQWKTTQMPPLSEAQLQAALELEYPATRELFRIVEMQPNDGGYLVKTAHVPMDKLRASIQSLEEAGLDVLWSGLPCHGIAAFINDHHDFLDDFEIQMYLDIREKQTEFGLIAASRFLYRRQLAVGQHQLQTGLTDVYQDFSDELHLTLTAASKTVDALPTKVWLMGEALPPDFPMAQLEAEQKIQFFTPQKTRLGGVLTDYRTPKLAGLIGLALEELGGNTFPRLRLQTAEQLGRITNRQRLGVFFRGVAIFILISLGLALSFSAQSVRAAKDAHWLAERSGEIRRLNRLSQETNRQLTEIKSLETWLAERGRELRFLQVLQENLPELTAIQAVTIEDGMLKNLSGTTPSVSGLLHRFRKNPVLKQLKLKGSITKAKDGREEFQLEGPLVTEEWKP